MLCICMWNTWKSEVMTVESCTGETKLSKCEENKNHVSRSRRGKRSFATTAAVNMCVCEQKEKLWIMDLACSGFISWYGISVVLAVERWIILTSVRMYIFNNYIPLHRCLAGGFLKMYFSFTTAVYLSLPSDTPSYYSRIWICVCGYIGISVTAVGRVNSIRTKAPYTTSSTRTPTSTDTGSANTELVDNGHCFTLGMNRILRPQ